MLGRVPEHKSLFRAPVGKGLPIGNLTSQFFANVYLHQLDRFVKHHLQCRFYLRYVDDFILLSPEPAELDFWKQEIAGFLQHRLLLELKPGARIRRVSEGADFLGYIVRPGYRLCRRRVVNNLKLRLEEFAARQCRCITVGPVLVECLHSPPAETARLRQVMASYFGHFKHADTWNLRCSLFARYPWLELLFQLQGRCLRERFNYSGVWCSLRQQVAFFRQRLPFDAVVLVQVGAYCEIYDGDVRRLAGPLRLWSRAGFRGMDLASGRRRGSERRLIETILAAGFSVAVFRETGSPGRYLKERALYEFYRIMAPG